MFNKAKFVHSMHICNASGNPEAKMNVLEDLDNGSEIISAIADAKGCIHYILRKEVGK